MDKSIKLEGLKNLRSMVKDIVFEALEKRSKGEKMETEAEHEAKESPEQEALEHATGLEVEDESKEAETEGSEEGMEESEEGEESPSPFRSEKDRIKANLFRGGEYAGMLGGSSECERPRSSGKGKPFPKRG